MSKRKRAANEYPPEMMEAWELAALGKLQLSFETKGAATNFRQQLHAYRKVQVEESAPNAFAHWYAHDLDVVEDPGYGVAASKWHIVCKKSEWKEQVRKQMEASVKPDAHIIAPTSLVPESLAKITDPDNAKSKLPTLGQSAMDEALSNLGFKP